MFPLLRLCKRLIFTEAAAPAAAPPIAGMPPPAPSMLTEGCSSKPWVARTNSWGVGYLGSPFMPMPLRMLPTAALLPDSACFSTFVSDSFTLWMLMPHMRTF